MPDRDDLIRERAYHIWEREGRPHGRNDEHWQLAAEEIAAEERALAAQKPAASPPQEETPVHSRPASAPPGRAAARPAAPPATGGKPGRKGK